MNTEEIGKIALANGTFIIYRTQIHNVYGSGYIRGIANTPIVGLGFGYIVETIEKYHSYDYPMMVVYENQINIRKSVVQTILNEMPDN